MAKIEGKVSRRYAKAIFELTQPTDYEARRDALFVVAEAWSQNSDLRDAVNNPAIPTKAREQVLADIIANVRPGDQDLVNFTLLLLSNKRLNALTQIAEMYAAMVDYAKKLLSLEITSAFELSNEEKNSLESKIRTQYGSMANLSWSVDADLLGGLMVRAGDLQLDSSVRGSLEKIKSQLIGS